MDNDLLKKFQSIRFSDLVESGSSPVYQEDIYKLCCDEEDDINSINSDNEPTQNIVKDRYSPEDISYWINFGHFRDKDKDKKE